MKRPNILLIYTDQQRLDSLNCYGSSFAQSPNIDKLASEGARFNHFYVNNPVCTPSRMSFLTGRYPSSLGVGINGICFPEEATPLNTLLARYNYQTAQIGKLHFDPHAKRNHKIPTPTYGFDTFILSDEPGCYDDAYLKWVETNCPEYIEQIREELPPAAKMYRGQAFGNGTDNRNTHQPHTFRGPDGFTHSDFVTDQVCEYIDTTDKKSFFAIAGFYAPHTPVNPPQKYVDMYNISDMKLPILGPDENFEDFLKDIPEEQWQKIAAYYYALCTHVDNCVGKILQALEKQGKTEDTIVIFTTDHGEYLGDHGRIQKGMPGHDCIVRVPYIIRYPQKIAADTIIDEVTEGVDFVPTILDYCGVQIPPFIQGKSLKPLLDGQTQCHKDSALIQLFQEYGKNGSTTLKTKEFMYNITSSGKEILYDRIKNPEENINVIDQSGYSSALSEMRKKLLEKLFEAGYNNLEREAMY